MNDAYRNGWLAHLHELGTNRNPYCSAAQCYSHNRWLSGWCARFSAIKHSGDLTLDEEQGCTDAG